MLGTQTEENLHYSNQSNEADESFILSQPELTEPQPAVEVAHPLPLVKLYAPPEPRTGTGINGIFMP